MKILSDEGLLTGAEMQTIRNEIIRYVSLESSTGRLAISQDTAKAQRDLTLRQVRELLDGIENPHYNPTERERRIHLFETGKHDSFNAAIQTMKALLET